MESNTNRDERSIRAANSRRNEPQADPAARPDWDPYAVWLTHIMKTPASPTQPEAPVKEPVGNAAGDSSWNPYTVWQALIKS